MVIEHLKLFKAKNIGAILASSLAFEAIKQCERRTKVKARSAEVKEESSKLENLGKDSIASLVQACEEMCRKVMAIYLPKIIGLPKEILMEDVPMTQRNVE